MLASTNRLRRSADFRRVARQGFRVSRSCLVMHVLAPEGGLRTDVVTRVGFTIGKTVGGSVTRHRVARRMRVAMGRQLDALPVGCTVVVRALPDAATASSQRIGEELQSAMSSALAKLAR